MAIIMLNVPPAPTFRDIRPDLRERLRSANAEREGLIAMAEHMEKTIQILEQMLADEERRFNPEATHKKKQPDEPLSEFLLRNLNTGQLRTKDDLRYLAEQAGYDVDGRSIHLTLVNLMKSNRAVEIGEGQFAGR